MAFQVSGFETYAELMTTATPSKLRTMSHIPCPRWDLINVKSLFFRSPYGVQVSGCDPSSPLLTLRGLNRVLRAFLILRLTLAEVVLDDDEVGVGKTEFGGLVEGAMRL